MSDKNPEPRQLRYHLDKAREDTSEKLQEAYVQGYLTDEEFEERLDLANRADATGDLERLLSDLPEESRELATTSSTALIRREERPERETLRVIFSGIEREGPWNVPGILEVQAVFGGVDLDLRQADLLPGETTVIRLSVLFGGLDIDLPPGVRVENKATAIFGGISTNDHRKENDCAHAGDVHILRLEGIILFGGVDISIGKPKKRKLLEYFQ